MAMNKYRFVARSPTGHIVKGYLQADDINQLREIMIDHNSELLKAKLVKNKKEITFFDSVNNNDILSLCDKLHMMIRAGIPLGEALELVANSFSKQKFVDALVNVSKEMKKGKPLSLVLQEYPDIFPAFFTTMIGLAEVSGNIKEILSYLRSYYQYEIKLKKKIQSSLFYPIILLVLAVIVVFVVCLVVVPTFVTVFREMKVNLPPITKFIIGFSNFLSKYFLLIIFLIIGIVVGLIFFKRSKTGKYFFDKFKIKLPVYKDISIINLTSRFCKSLNILILSGLPTVVSLQTASNLIGNEYVKDQFNFAIDEIKRGESLSKSLETINIFPEMLIQTLSISEQTSSLGESLTILSSLYEEEAHNKLQKLTSIIEPTFILLIAGFVILIIASIFIPLFSMLDNIAAF